MHIHNNFDAHNWAKEMINKANVDKPTPVDKSKAMTKDFSTVAWFKSMFGTSVKEDCTEVL